MTDINFTDVKVEKISLDAVFFQAMKLGYSTAIWRNPGDATIHIITCLSKELPILHHPDLENMASGFLVSPYENDNNIVYYFIRSDLHLTYEKDTLKTVTHDHKIPLKYIENFLYKAGNEINDYNDQLSKTFLKEHQILDKTDYEKLIQLSIEKIHRNEFQKVVPSRIFKIDLPEDFNIVSKFLKLSEIHPRAFISLLSIPGKGTWIGASPELLIKITDRKYFYTSAVAGTQSGNDVDNLSEVAWKQKEIEEQAFVSRYIINCFKKIRLREFEEIGPKTIKAGGLLHLRTDYIVDMEAVNFPELGSVMMKLLHPTSAVCGMPREAASSFLRKYEKFDREFYSGYLGPVNIDSEISLYVNLRCAKIALNAALLYAGAGVTRDSDPEKEWLETELKMNTIKTVLLA